MKKNIKKEKIGRFKNQKKLKMPEFKLEGIDYVAQLYYKEDNKEYPEIIKLTGERPRSMKDIARQYLRPHGIEVPCGANTMNTHSAIRRLIDFLEEQNAANDEIVEIEKPANKELIDKNKIKDEITKPFSIEIEKKQKDISLRKGSNNPPIEGDILSVKIFDQAMEEIREINREYRNRHKHLLFDNSVHDYTDDIKESCKILSQCKDLLPFIYKVIFKDFILNLYIIIYETTRKPNPNYNSKNGKSFYNFYLPYEFLKNAPTKDFMDVVGTFRHHYAHLEPEYKDKVMINKKSYGDALNKLLKSRNEPKSREEFHNLQIEVLNLFKTSMEILLKIVKNDLNCHPNHH